MGRNPFLMRADLISSIADPMAASIENLESACRKRGIKLTQQRLEIFREVATTSDHPDAETVFRRVRRHMPTVSLDTVYRTLWLLKDLRLVDTLGSARERARFDANLTRHHHFVCLGCGLTRDFSVGRLDSLELPQSVQEFGSVQTTIVEARGLCKTCAADKAPKTKQKKERRK